MSGTLINSLNWWATARAATPAIVVGDDQVTYQQLERWATSVAEWLVELGVQPGDRIGVMAANSLQWAVLSQACLLSGALLAPVNPRFTLSEASFLLVERYRCTVLFHDADRRQLASELGQLSGQMQIQPLDSIDRFRDVAPSGKPLPQNLDADTEIVIIPTSGSTGRPKGVVYSHRSMLSYLTETALTQPAAIDKGRVIIFAPLCTSAGYVVMTQYLGYGGTVFLEQAFDPAQALEKIVRHRITSMMGAPIFFERMAAVAGFVEADLSSLQFCLVGGAQVSRGLLETWLAKGVLLRQIYGQTEVGGYASINTDEAAISHPEKCGRGSIFTQIAIVDPFGKPLPAGTPGEIAIRSPSVMTRYWDDPEATAAALVDGWVRTGDIGVLDEDGLLTMIDRLKDIIISGGMNISSAELERVIAEYQGVQEVAVIAARDESFGETPLAIIHGPDRDAIPDILQHCSTHLSSFKLPRYLVVSDTPLPRLATGKLAKPQLRKEYANAHVELTKVR